MQPIAPALRAHVSVKMNLKVGSLSYMAETLTFRSEKRLSCSITQPWFTFSQHDLSFSHLHKSRFGGIQIVPFRHPLPKLLRPGRKRPGLFSCPGNARIPPLGKGTRAHRTGSNCIPRWRYPAILHRPVDQQMTGIGIEEGTPRTWRIPKPRPKTAP